MSMMEWRPFNQASLEFQAFTTGGSKYPNKSSGVEIGDTATHLDEVELTSSPTKGSLRDITNQDQARSGEVAGVQSDTAMNISRASLKRIDLALRAKLEARQNNVENATHPTNDNEDQMQGALNPPFNNSVHDLVQNLSPAIMIITETKVSGTRAKDITDRLPFDGAIHANNIGLTGAIYASPRFAERKLLWENLITVASLHSMPSVMAGDFNEVLDGEDKFKGRRVQERINRVFVNTKWNNIYSEACVTHLERAHSDHSTIILKLKHEAGVQFSRPFRFKPIWLFDPSFPSVERVTWSASNSLAAAVTNFAAKAKEWNKNQFGNIFHRKRRLGARLRGVQFVLVDRPSSSLIDLERGLRVEYSEVLHLEEEFWSMKSRITWIIEGDRKTAFFLMSALVHRRRNKITCIKDRLGNWLNGDSIITVHKTGLGNEDKGRLEVPVTDDEIFDALKALKPYKTPGPEGLYVGFFQRFWLIVGNLVKTVVKSIFSTRVMPEYLNKNLITLIPKCKSLESLNNYRPISLCNTVYKFVTKIIVGSIRHLLPSLVFSLQIAFVPGRKRVDNAIIVQEIVHSMSRRKGRIGLMAIKINLEKEYDHLEWSFIRDMLKLFNFPNHLTSLIMSCVSISSISVLVNDGGLDYFHPSKGIHQGDPLSPYLFILCMEVLGALITQKCEAKLWDPVRVASGGIAFLHPFFTDDLVLFAKADQKNCIAIKDAIGTFCVLSGQKVSDEKSRVFCSPNISREAREELCNTLGY
ncbi:uncharacterized protein LOC112028379 [Quercus suber]|uniref:uncharacterized protein LOC112028379 n=1 Tax=Quercus suber TaxID=58331 RepID=UPI0032DF2EAF